ncbi:carbonic anhydrase-like [Gigantopelta aegis]|uniref:carbonic anhydrase-like n=1 Tax=Gigantopelta aegis TaxID=1735272 RepID=UPI001B88E015|nr:carbonic anhydrase-like [Gigantopelta aegis]
MLTTTILLGVTLWSWVIQPVYGGAGHKWTYRGDLGPEHWHLDYPTCGGQQQSPIEVKTDQVVPEAKLADFNLNQLSNTKNVSMVLANVGGHTVEVAVSGSPIYVTGGGLEGRYRLEQFHFHWGLKDERGSEHVIDGRHFPMEIHIVLYNDKYANFSSAVHKEKGLAVFAFFYKIGEENNNMFKMLTHFPDIEFKDTSKPIATFPISSLLPKKFNSWFRYDGSLTTPPCSETVTWTLFKDEIHISEAQIQKFRGILENFRGERNKTLVDDFRPLQKLHSRKVYTNHNFEINSSNRPVTVDLIMTVTVILVKLNTCFW